MQEPLIPFTGEHTDSMADRNWRGPAQVCLLRYIHPLPGISNPVGLSLVPTELPGGTQSFLGAVCIPELVWGYRKGTGRLPGAALFCVQVSGLSLWRSATYS